MRRLTASARDHSTARNAGRRLRGRKSLPWIQGVHSYRSSDREWAEKVFASLVSRAIPAESPFLDTKRLVAGDDWEPQPDGALDESEHLVVLWSAKAADPDGYVNEERKHFELFCHRPSVQQPGSADEEDHLRPPEREPR